MARRKDSLLEVLMEIASKLPWQAGLALALVAYFIFHHYASLPPIVPTTLGSNGPGHTLGDSLSRQLVVSFSMVFQYLVPLCFALGAFISYRNRRRQAELHRNVSANPSREALEKLSWREFEHLTAELFRRDGYRVVQQGGDGPDGGVDLELYMGKDKYLVQCKQWKTSKVGVAIVRELYGVMTARGAVGGYVVASGEFTEDAKNFAEGRSIQLVPAQKVLTMLKQQSSQQATQPTSPPPVTSAVPSCPSCDSPMVLRVTQKGELAGTKFWGCSCFPACRGIRKVG
ncbi:restriction endonuclease [Pseudogulbenkiania ferrooxidans]|uniref:Restriction endonuclease n=1 Tax=Pseudogulbenkiania ferrooxidans 2002 TaxID=279714 RepID=B9Z8V1_9NEIS|nr:restriction endonuclease [Pseudogulbenkiania ferrooxidans]EEG06770.1 restriction endonuclease [Pseudogulbenkiania ferrooxidans 2002]